MVSPISYCSCISQTSFTKMENLLVMDQLKTMLRTERKYRVRRGLRINDSDTKKNPYNEWRKKICQWSYKVIDHFKIDREVVSCAMNILDRYLVKEKNNFDRDGLTERNDGGSLQTLDSRTFQLIAMTSLYLSIKLFDDEQHSLSRKLRLSSIVELSRGQFCENEITEMER